MPAVIVPAACPPPQCNVAVADVGQLVDALAAYHASFEQAFRRPEQHARAAVYLNGLASDLPRKTTERIALTQGVNVRDLQHFIGQSHWSCPSRTGCGRRPTKLRLRYPYQRSRRVDAIARRIPSQNWQPYLIKEGSKGPIICAFAFVRVGVVRKGLPGATVRLVIRRNLEQPSEVSFYLSNALASCELQT